MGRFLAPAQPGPRRLRELLAGLELILAPGVSPKKCGHMEGKQVIATAEMETKIRAVVAARRSPDFVIIARTDARAVEGMAGGFIVTVDGFGAGRGRVGCQRPDGRGHGSGASRGDITSRWR